MVLKLSIIVKVDHVEGPQHMFRFKSPPTMLGCEREPKIRAVSKDCVSPQPQNFQNDVISKKNLLAHQRSTFFLLKIICSFWILITTWPMMMDFRLNKSYKVMILHVLKFISCSRRLSQSGLTKCTNNLKAILRMRGNKRCENIIGCGTLYT